MTPSFGATFIFAVRLISSLDFFCWTFGFGEGKEKDSNTQTLVWFLSEPQAHRYDV